MDTAGAKKGKTPQLPCVWVLSGVLSYRLCDRDYDCEHCELHHALSGDKGHSSCKRRSVLTEGSSAGSYLSDSWEAAAAGAHLSHLLSGCRLYLDRPYCPPHFWLTQTAEDLVTVGLDGTLLRFLQPVKRIVLPSPGIRLDRKQPCGWIAREHIAVPLRMPIAGEVVETNERYVEAAQPWTLEERDDWLFRIRPSEPLADVDSLLTDEDTLAWHAERLGVVRRYLMAVLAPEVPAGLGTVMADGGAPELRLEEVLGTEDYRNLIREIAPPPQAP